MGGSHDLSFSPYAPMMFNTSSSSTSRGRPALADRTRRQSAPTPPVAATTQTKPLTGWGTQTPASKPGPTLEECLVIPDGGKIFLGSTVAVGGVDRPLVSSQEAEEEVSLLNI